MSVQSGGACCNWCLKSVAARDEFAAVLSCLNSLNIHDIVPSWLDRPPCLSGCRPAAAAAAAAADAECDVPCVTRVTQLLSLSLVRTFSGGSAEPMIWAESLSTSSRTSLYCSQCLIDAAATAADDDAKDLPERHAHSVQDPAIHGVEEWNLWKIPP